MYTRSYFGDSQDRLNLPTGYDGTAFADKEEGRVYESDEATTLLQGEERSEQTFAPISSGGIPLLSGLFGNGGIFPKINLKIPQIGVEEILILATAAFLIFSKSGDLECAIILLLLLLIN